MTLYINIFGLAQISRDSEYHSHNQQRPPDDRASNDAGPAPAKSPAHTLAQDQPKNHRKHRHQEGVEMPRRGKISVCQLMKRAKRAAAWTLPSGQLVERADRIEARRLRVEQVQYDSSDRRYQQ